MPPNVGVGAEISLGKAVPCGVVPLNFDGRGKLEAGMGSGRRPHVIRRFQFAFPEDADTTPARASGNRFSDRRPSSAQDPRAVTRPGLHLQRARHRLRHGQAGRSVTARNAPLHLQDANNPGTRREI